MQAIKGSAAHVDKKIYPVRRSAVTAGFNSRPSPAIPHPFLLKIPVDRKTGEGGTLLISFPGFEKFQIMHSGQNFTNLLVLHDRELLGC